MEITENLYRVSPILNRNYAQCKYRQPISKFSSHIVILRLYIWRALAMEQLLQLSEKTSFQSSRCLGSSGRKKERAPMSQVKSNISIKVFFGTSPPPQSFVWGNYGQTPPPPPAPLFRLLWQQTKIPQKASWPFTIKDKKEKRIPHSGFISFRIPLNVFSF